MGSNRITQLHVYLIGVVMMLIIGVGLYFALLKPVYADIETRSGEVKGLENTSVDVDGKQFKWTETMQDGKADNSTGKKAEKAAREALAAAKVRKANAERELQILEARKQLAAANRIDLGDGPPGEPKTETLVRRTMSNWLVLPSVVVPLMQNTAQKLAAKHGIKVEVTFSAPPRCRILRRSRATSSRGTWGR